MKTNKFFLVAALTALALTCVSCSPDDPIVPAVGSDVVTSGPAEVTYLGTVWRANFSHNPQINPIPADFENMMYFLTDTTGVLTSRCVSYNGVPGDEIFGDDHLLTFDFTYIKDGNSLYIYLDGRTYYDEYVHNAANSSLTQILKNGGTPMVYHKVTD